MPSTLTRVLSAVGCTLVVTACGGGGSTSSQTRLALQERVGALVSAVNAEDYPTARTALDALRADVEDAQRLGALADTRAVELTRLTDSVQAGLPDPAAPPTSTPPTAPSAPATSAPAATAPATQAPSARPSRSAPVIPPPPTQEPGKKKGRGKDDAGKSSD